MTVQLENLHQVTRCGHCGGPTMSEGRVDVRDRLGKLLKCYYQQAA
jgi:hypothetical protein